MPSNAKPIPPTLPSNGNNITNTPPPQPPAPIKTENIPPSYPPQAPPKPQPQYQAPSFNGEPMTARDRAAMNLHQSFGQRAGPQIAQLQSSQPRTPSQQSASPTGPYIKQEDTQSNFSAVQDYPADVKPQVPTPLRSSQTDGTDDARDTWAAEYARRKALAAVYGAEGDHLMRAQFQAKQQELEGGGLLLALEERTMPSKSVSRKLNDLAGTGPSTTPSITRAQGDATGDDDDDIDDEDAINSDLDDPDDLAANEEDGENTDQVMLCTYDKVQRVKNKWKCTLKDGIFRVDGSE